jgi:hypothetical protein
LTGRSADAGARLLPRQSYTGLGAGCKEIAVEFFPLCELPRRGYMYRRAGKPCSIRTVWRWALKGCRGHVLRTCLRGMTRCTCDGWALEFLEKINADSTIPSPPLPTRTPTHRQQQIQRAERELQQAGI